MFYFDTLLFSERICYLEKWQTIRKKAGTVLIEGNNVRLVLQQKRRHLFIHNGVTDTNSIICLYQVEKKVQP